MWRGLDQAFDIAEPAVQRVRPPDLQTTGVLNEAGKRVVDQILMGENEFCWMLAKDSPLLTLPRHKPSLKRKICWSIPTEWNAADHENIFAAISSGIIIARTSSIWDDKAYKVLRRNLGEWRIIEGDCSRHRRD